MAYTHYYVSALAGGGGSGTEVSPFTLEEGRLAAGPGKWFHVNGDGIYSISANWTPAAAGTYDSPCVWQGYTSTIDDGGFATLSFTGGYYLSLNTANGYYNNLYNLDILGGTTASYVVFPHTTIYLYRCKVTVRRTDAAGEGIHYYGTLLNCYITANNTSYNHIGVNYFADTGNAINCIATNLYIGFKFFRSRYPTCARGCVSIGYGSGYGFDLSATDYNKCNIVGCVSANYSVGIYADVSSSVSISSQAVLKDNIIYDCDYGIQVVNWQASWYPFIYNNAFGSITTANYSGFSDNILEANRFSDVTLTESPFVSYPTDLRLNNAAGGGALCRNIAVPLLDGVHTTYVDLGAIGPKEDYPIVGNVRNAVDYMDGLMTGTMETSGKKVIGSGGNGRNGKNSGGLRGNIR